MVWIVSSQFDLTLKSTGGKCQNWSSKRPFQKIKMGNKLETNPNVISDSKKTSSTPTTKQKVFFGKNPAGTHSRFSLAGVVHSGQKGQINQQSEIKAMCQILSLRSLYTLITYLFLKNMELHENSNNRS